MSTHQEGAGTKHPNFHTHIVQSLETGFIPVLFIFQVLDEVAMMKRMQKQIEQLESELAKLRGSQVNFLNSILANRVFQH